MVGFPASIVCWQSLQKGWIIENEGSFAGVVFRHQDLIINQAQGDSISPLKNLLAGKIGKEKQLPTIQLCHDDVPFCFPEPEERTRRISVPGNLLPRYCKALPYGIDTKHIDPQIETRCDRRPVATRESNFAFPLLVPQNDRLFWKLIRISIPKRDHAIHPGWKTHRANDAFLCPARACQLEPATCDWNSGAGGFGRFPRQ